MAYQGALLAASSGQLYYYLPATGAWTSSTQLTGITAFCEFEGSLYIGTHAALYRLDGQLKASNPSAAPTTLNQFDFKISRVWKVTGYNGYFGYFSEYNFATMTAWRGHLWYFASGQLFMATPGATGQPLQIRPQPVYGSSLGMDSCSNLLVACIANNATGGGAVQQVWVNDGSFDLSKGEGWFKLTPAGPYRFPFENSGYSQGAINLLNVGSANYSFTRFLLDSANPIGTKTDNYGQPYSLVSGSLQLPIIAPQDLTQDTTGKVQAVQLLRVGLEWSIVDGGSWWPTPDTTNTAQSILNMQVSTDGGKTFTDLAAPTPPSYNFYAISPVSFGGNRVEFPLSQAQATAYYPASATLNGTLSDTPVSDPGWLIRINWQGYIMPLIRRIWLDYRSVDLAQATGRTWEFDLAIAEPFVNLDGSGDGETAQAKLDRLWNLWQTGKAVQFQDLDNGTIIAKVYTVKVTGLTQERIAPGSLPNLAAGWLVRVKLEEVFETTSLTEQ